jgi:hypothetical protein
MSSFAVSARVHRRTGQVAKSNCSDPFPWSPGRLTYIPVLPRIDTSCMAEGWDGGICSC